MTRPGIRTVLVAAALLLAAVAVLFGPRRGAAPDVATTDITRVPDPATVRQAEPTPRADPVPPVGTADVEDPAPSPAPLPTQEASPDLYATGSPPVPAEPQLEAPTSPSPAIMYDDAPAPVPYDSPTGSQLDSQVLQFQVIEPQDQSPTSMPFDVPGAQASDPAVGGQGSSPTEAPPQ